MLVNFNPSVVVIFGILFLALSCEALKRGKEEVHGHVFEDQVMEPQGSVSRQSEWPAATGRAIDDVVQEIKGANTGLTVVKVEEGSMVTMDFRQDRVRVYYNKETGIVVGTPKIG